MDYQTLHDELINDPLGRGYSGMTDSEAADDLNTVYRTITLERLDPADVYEAIDQADWTGLTTSEQSEITDILHIGTVNGLLATPGSRARTRFVAIFGGQSQTITNLLDIMTRDISRGQELGIGYVKAGDVQKARAL